MLGIACLAEIGFFLKGNVILCTWFNVLNYSGKTIAYVACYSIFVAFYRNNSVFILIPLSPAFIIIILMPHNAVIALFSVETVSIAIPTGRLLFRFWSRICGKQRVIFLICYRNYSTVTKRLCICGCRAVSVRIII